MDTCMVVNAGPMKTWDGQDISIHKGRNDGPTVSKTPVSGAWEPPFLCIYDGA